MVPIPFTVANRHARPLRGFVVEQGVPVPPLEPGAVARLRVETEAGEPVPASVSAEAEGPDGRVRWVHVALAVTIPPGERRAFRLVESVAAAHVAPMVTRPAEAAEPALEVVTPAYRATFRDPGHLSLHTASGPLLEGEIGFDIRGDARSFVGQIRPLWFEPEGFTVLEDSGDRAVVQLAGRYRAPVPKSEPPVVDERRWIECELEFLCYRFAPTIRFRWRITSFLKFNCAHGWFERYALKLPLPPGAAVRRGEEEGSRYARWIELDAPGGRLAVTAPFYDDLGAGAGLKVESGALLQGGIDPPIDGSFGGAVPDIHRQFFYGMSRTFTGQIVPEPDAESVAAELDPVGITLPAAHYSACGALPEDGDTPAFGAYEAIAARAAEWLLQHQWRGTLWWGEWWREWDVTRQQGVEEAHNGNAALAPLCHYFRTGDERFLACARRAMTFTFDIQFCKQTDGPGPFMHTRRFLLDHQNWFHQRYQRIGGIVLPSLVFGERSMRERTIDMVRTWAERYVAEDGTPMHPEPDGTLRPQTEIAMTNFADSLAQCWQVTGDPFFLDKARRTCAWALKKIATPEALRAEVRNWNDSRYLLRGLIPTFQATQDPALAEGILQVARYVLGLPHRDPAGEVRFVLEHAWFHAFAHKLAGDAGLLAAIRREVDAELACERGDGTYPYKVADHPYPTYWISCYDAKTVVAYLPVLAARLEAVSSRPSAVGSQRRRGRRQ